MTNVNLQGKWALVTGASSGLGVDFADILASNGANIVLVARRADKLEAVAEDLRQRHSVAVKVIALDLSVPGAVTSLLEQLKAGDVNPTVLINNAGVGAHGPFADSEWARVQAMLQLNIVTLTELTHAVLPAMRAAGEGYILQVGSLAAFQACPNSAAYAATKSYVLHLGEALNFELKGAGIKVAVLNPGITETEFFDVSGHNLTKWLERVMMKSRPVAEAGIDALFAGDASVIAGTLNKATAFLNRVLPRRTVVATAARYNSAN